MDLCHKSAELAIAAAHPLLPAVHIAIAGTLLPVYTDM